MVTTNFDPYSGIHNSPCCIQSNSFRTGGSELVLARYTSIYYKNTKIRMHFVLSLVKEIWSAKPWKINIVVAFLSTVH